MVGSVNILSCIFSRKFALVLCIGLIALLVNHRASADQNSNEKKPNVLIINSYHQGMQWSDRVCEGIRQRLAKVNVNIQIEYLDTKRLPFEEVEKILLERLKMKGQLSPPDIIIVSDNNALALVNRYRQELFTGVPIVFCGINGFKPDMIDQLDDVTGILETHDWQGNCELAQHMNPALARMIVIADQTPTGIKQLGLAKNLMGDEYQGVKIEYWSDLSFDELREKLASLSPTTDAVLLAAFYRDNMNKFKGHIESAEFISKYSRAAVYGRHAYILGSGIVGGKMISTQEHGGAAAEMVIRILQGEKASDISIVTQSTFQTVIDYPQLDRFGLSVSQLPSEAVVINQPNTLWHQHKELILFVLGVMLLEALALMLLGLLLYRTRTRATRSIAKREKRYALAQEAAKICAWEWDLETQIIEWSSQAEKVFGTDPDKWTHNLPLFFDYVHPADRKVLQENVDKCLETGENLHAEFRLKADDDAYYWKRSQAEVHNDEEGNPIKMVGVTMDINEQKLIEKSYESYYHATNASITPMLITNDEGIVLNANPAFSQLFGYSEKEVLGRNLWDLSAKEHEYLDAGLNKEAYQAIQDAYGDVVKLKLKGEWSGDMISRCKSGKLLTLRMYISAIEDAMHGVQGYVAMPIDMTQDHEKHHDILLECYKAISGLAETRDDETGTHLRRISSLCRKISEAYGQSRRFCEDITIYSELHDIGKVGIPDAILLAPRKLTADEYEIMKEHAALGHRILDGRPTLEMAAEIARWHHEHWDGRGYPDALAGEAIPLSARIMAIADVYDALRSKRRYKDGWTHAETMAYFREKSGTQFDPELVEALFEIENEVENDYVNYIEMAGKTA